MVYKTSFREAVLFVLLLCGCLEYTVTASDHFVRSTCSARPKELWNPAKGATWNYNLLHPITNPSALNTSIEVWDIDLFDNTAATIKDLKDRGLKVICYFSAGSYENWRPDASNFSSADLGNDLDGWPGEKWLNTSSQSVRRIMQARLDIAATKGCDGVDPDNVDGYNNDNGLGLTQADAIDYVMFLANQAHERKLAVGLKNAGDIIASVIDCMDWSVNEQCVQYTECDTYAPFISQGKPVFHVEYPKGDDVNNDKPVSQAKYKKICQDESSAGFSTIIKNIDLDDWIQAC